MVTTADTTTYSENIRDFVKSETHSKKWYDHRNKNDRVTLAGPGVVKTVRVLARKSRNPQPECRYTGPAREKVGEGAQYRR